jgi:hypothetical protein
MHAWLKNPSDNLAANYLDYLFGNSDFVAFEEARTA